MMAFKGGQRRAHTSRSAIVLRAVASVLLIVGLCAIAYPMVRQAMFDAAASGRIGEFDAFAQSLRDAQGVSHEAGEVDLDGLLSAMREYNARLVEEGQSGLRDAWSYQEPSFDLTKWGLPDNVVGHIAIPKMGEDLPIYLGASEANMAHGAVHLSQTSLPIGADAGQSANSVIAAHRGAWEGAMFRDIEKLEIGDPIYITNLWETLEYRVAEIKVISPDDINKVLIQPGRDLVTLSTCHPYGQNYQRYIVYCERVH